MKPTLFAAVALAAASLTPARADIFDFTSCHISGGCAGLTSFGTVELTQVGANVHFDVVLDDGNRFIETGSGGHSLFLFNDANSGHTVTNIVSTFNGSPVNVGSGLSGATNTPDIMADGTGTFTGQVFCTVEADCNGASGIPVNDLHFDVTGATLAQLETANAKGNIFVADILLGANGFTGPVDVDQGACCTRGVPDGGTTVMLLGSVLMALETLRRRFA